VLFGPVVERIGGNLGNISVTDCSCGFALRDLGRGHKIGRVSQILPPNLHCDECEAILRKLLDARQVDLEEMRKHLFEAARSSGREPEEMRDVWLSSIMKMPDDEMRTVLRAHHARATEMRRKKSDHEIATGHSVDQLVSMVLLGYRRRPLPDSK